MIVPGVRPNQAERRFVAFVFVKVGTALSADWMRPSRVGASLIISDGEVNQDLFSGDVKLLV